MDQFGNVTCENEEKDDSAKFEISVCDDFSGRWAFRFVVVVDAIFKLKIKLRVTNNLISLFRSIARGYFLGASADNLICSAKSPSDGELWLVNIIFC